MAEPGNTELSGTVRLPDGRQLPVIVIVDWSIVPKAASLGPESLLLRAVEAFGKTEKALSWLNTPNAEFGGMTPIAAADTQQGRSVCWAFFSIWSMASQLDRDFTAVPGNPWGV